MLSYLLYLYKKVQHKHDALLFLITTSTIYNFVLNTNQNIKNSSQYQYEPILWKLNSILNDSTLSIYVLIIIYTYVLYNSRLRITKVSAILLLYFYVHSIKIQFIFTNLMKIAPYNVTLFNGLLLVHPICLYFSYAYVMYIIALTTYNRVSISEYLTAFFLKRKNFITYSFIALLLGCWWAQQEVSWGGWWNWDPIEIVALLVFIISLIINHLPQTQQKVIFFIRPTLFIFVVTTYFVSRYDLLNSIHSFALASKSQHYLELKLLFLYFVVFCNIQHIFIRKLSRDFNKTITSVCIFFCYYYAYIIISTLYDIFLNTIKLLNTTPNGDKYVYIGALITITVHFLFDQSSPTIKYIFFLIVSAWLSVHNIYITIACTCIIVYFKKNFWLKYHKEYFYVKTIAFHSLFLVLLYFLLSYSNVEIFFTKPELKHYLNKKFMTTITQQTGFGDYADIKSYLTRTSVEAFFQKNLSSVKLLTQHITSNSNYNYNTINLSKTVLFVQNYLYTYIFVIAVAISVWFSKTYKSGIV